VQSHRNQEELEIMKLKVVVLTIVVSIALIAFTGAYGDTKPKDSGNKEAMEEQRPSEKPEISVVDSLTPPIEKLIIGKWTIDRKDTLPNGNIVFDEKGKYARTEYQDMKSSATVKGAYVLDTSVKPCRLDLIMGDDLKAPNYLRLRGIIKILTKDILLITWSPGDEFPTEFAEPEKDNYTAILTRVEEVKTKQ